MSAGEIEALKKQIEILQSRLSDAREFREEKANAQEYNKELYEIRERIQFLKPSLTQEEYAFCLAFRKRKDPIQACNDLGYKFSAAEKAEKFLKSPVIRQIVHLLEAEDQMRFRLTPDAIHKEMWEMATDKNLKASDRTRNLVALENRYAATDPRFKQEDIFIRETASFKVVIKQKEVPEGLDLPFVPPIPELPTDEPEDAPPEPEKKFDSGIWG